MNANTFQIGDKVVLSYACCANMATVPKLAPGRVYCIKDAFMVEARGLFAIHQRVHLCGVRLHKHMKDPEHGLPAEAFRRVGEQRKEEA